MACVRLAPELTIGSWCCHKSTASATDRSGPALQSYLPSHLQKTIGRKIEPVRRSHRIAIKKREQYPPPWRQTRRRGAPHHLVAGRKIDSFIKINQATLLLGAGERR